ncbi:hypothetical protein ABS71_06035 [bacterium SCN 62-11]|nr:MAG: hypothetical protein ABS71_06035 [bacterium SCN 62-11]
MLILGVKTELKVNSPNECWLGGQGLARSNYSLKMLDIGQLAQARDWQLVIGFGSRTRGQSRPGSDFDLAVLRGSGQHSAEGLELALGERNLDLTWLDEASWLMWAEVARDGVALFESSQGLYDEFVVQATLRKWNSEVWRRRDRAFLRRFLERKFQLNLDLILRKSAQLAEYLTELEPLTQLSREQFAADKLKLYAAERLVELIVESAGSINTEVGQALAKTPPSDYYSSFFSLVTAGWIDQELAIELAEWARLRNALVHRYDSVAAADFNKMLAKCISPWRRYLSGVSGHLGA